MTVFFLFKSFIRYQSTEYDMNFVKINSVVRLKTGFAVDIKKLSMCYNTWFLV